MIPHLNDFQRIKEHSLQTPDRPKIQRYQQEIKLFFQRIFRLKRLNSNPIHLNEWPEQPGLLPKKPSFSEYFKSTLVMILGLCLLFTWKSTLPMLQTLDQIENDIEEQRQLIEMEKKNEASLKTLSTNHQTLDEKINAVYAAVPKGDEEAEVMISNLEQMAAENRMIIEGIGIRKLNDSQIRYHELIGVAEIYEYTFTLEGGLENIMSFIKHARNSLRIMDIVAMEMEEGKGLYRASFVLYAYHLMP